MRNGLLHATILSLALAGVTACGDDVTDPEAFAESAEAEAIMLSARDLPVLPELLDRAAPDSDTDRALAIRARELWAAGTLASDPRGAARRQLAIGYALPVLVGSVPGEDWAAAASRMADWMTTVDGLMDRVAVPEVRARLRVARRYLDRADAVEVDPRRRARYLLLAMSELVETTPRYVARHLVADAATALAAGPELDDRRLDRAVRLKDWAERAVEEGDYLLAIQRAYYAIQLAEGR
ncbi:MAG: hypothetical protein ACOCUW_04565 [Gemmatimonadota bacterium]